MPRKAKTRAPQALQKRLLNQISRGAALCRELERGLALHPGPKVELLIKLFRVIILNSSVKANAEPDELRLVNALIKPVLDWARLEEKRKGRKFAEQKYHEQVAAERAARENAVSEASGDRALSPETLEKIERELKLF